MLFPLWTAKPGSGCTVVAAALATSLARRADGGVLLVDLGGDLPAALGLADPAHGVTDWLAADAASTSQLGALTLAVAPGLALLPRGRQPRWLPRRAEYLVDLLGRSSRPIVIDVGVVDPQVAAPIDSLRRSFARLDEAVLVTTPCYLALRRMKVVESAAGLRPRRVALLQQPGRGIDRAQLADLVNAPVVAEIAHDPAVARAVDRGLLATGRPRAMHRQVEALLR